ncbi:hypothetical protein YC2023_109152 [Brassica napus]
MWEMLKVSTPKTTHHNDLRFSTGCRHDNINPETLRRENCKTGGSFVSEYADHDIAGTLAAEDAGQVAKLRSVLESVDHKRRKILQQMRGDAHLLNLEEGSPPIQPKFFSPIHHKMWR